VAAGTGTDEAAEADMTMRERAIGRGKAARSVPYTVAPQHTNNATRHCTHRPYLLGWCASGAVDAVDSPQLQAKCASSLEASHDEIRHAQRTALKVCVIVKEQKAKLTQIHRGEYIHTLLAHLFVLFDCL
jgi:hypothetical protein